MRPSNVAQFLMVFGTLCPDAFGSSKLSKLYKGVDRPSSDVVTVVWDYYPGVKAKILVDGKWISLQNGSQVLPGDYMVSLVDICKPAVPFHFRTATFVSSFTAAAGDTVTLRFDEGTFGGNAAGPNGGTCDGTVFSHTVTSAAFLREPGLIPALPNIPARVQSAAAANPRLALRAALVLTPEFCATRLRNGYRRPTGSGDRDPAYGLLAVGEAACAALEPALKGVFTSLTRVTASSSAADAQVVLLPRIVDVGATFGTWSTSDRTMMVLLEWTVKDASGGTVWIGTVQGSAKRPGGNGYTYFKNLKLIVQDSMKDAAEQSAAKMLSAPQVRRLAE